MQNTHKLTMRGPYKELLVLVHPNWLTHATMYGLDDQRVIELMKDFYSGGRAENIDWQRYRKAMFDIYGRAIIEASKRPDVLVVIFAVPMNINEYRAILRSDKASIKKSSKSDVLRFIDFARKLLGKRLIIINSPGYKELYEDSERLANLLQKKKIKFAEDFVIRGGGEISKGCVQTVVTKLRQLLSPKECFVDFSICGDLIIKERLTKRKLEKRYPKPRPKASAKFTGRRLKI
ncbi:MAG: hypothetical protein QXM75_04460 [Candidatus Diapherotrites archaeon]